MTEGEPGEPEVWFVSNFPPPVHGVAVFNAGLVEQLRSRRIRHRIFRIGTRGSLTGTGRLGGAKAVTDVASLAELSLASVSRLLRSQRTQPVVYFTPSQGGTAVLRDWMVARQAHAAGIPLVAHIHGCAWLNVWRSGGWDVPIMHNVLEQCQAVICLGPTYAQAMHGATGFPCVGVNNGVKVQQAVTARTPPLREDRVELLYLSNLIKSKGLWQAAQSVGELERRGLQVHLTCAGSWLRDAERNQFELEFASELDTGLIELFGFADEHAKAALLSRAHFFILPTAYPLEGQPLALIEAMAHGVVPITTTQGAIVDLLGFEQWQHLARREHRDPGEIANTVDRLTADSAAYAALSLRCLDHTRRFLNQERCLNAVLETLMRVAESGLQG